MAEDWRSLAAGVLAVVASFGFIAGNGTSPDPPARAGDLYRIGAEDLHLQCQGNGSPTVVLLGGQGSTTTWTDFRKRLGGDIRTCAWDYPGVGWSTGAPMMTAARAAAALDATLDAAAVPRPVVLVGHSIAGLTVRLFVGQHLHDVSGVVLFDPTVPSFARMFDEQNFQPEWDGTASAEQVETVTSWPDIPFQILRHDPAVYAEQEIWSADTEAQWAAAQTAYAGLAPHGQVTLVADSGHNIYRDAPTISMQAVQHVVAQLH